MSFNSDLAEVFEQMAQLLELTGANRFRVNAHAKAARVVGDHAGDLEPLAHDAAALTALDGIGKGTAEKIAEFAGTGAIAEHRELLDAVPPGLLTVMEVPGAGAQDRQAAVGRARGDRPGLAEGGPRFRGDPRPAPDGQEVR
jgi:DNA polymerase (family 10)